MGSVAAGVVRAIVNVNRVPMTFDLWAALLLCEGTSCVFCFLFNLLCHLNAIFVFFCTDATISLF